MKGIDMPDSVRLGLFLLDLAGGALNWTCTATLSFWCGVVGHRWMRFGDLRWCGRCKEGL